MANEIELKIPSALDGARVDKAVATLLQVSRATAGMLVAKGVTLDGKAARPSDRVTEGQLLASPEPDAGVEVEPQPVEFGVRFEDDHVVVVDKPAGLVVHPGARVSSGTLVSGLIHRYPDLIGVGQPGRWGLVHRLDRGTSGLLLVARTQDAYASLVEQMRGRRVSRTYTALVEGRLGAPTGTIDAPIGRDPARPTRRAVVHGGKPARTHFQVNEHFSDADVSLVEVRLETGRTHQIRVHMASIGHAVVGDRTYGATRRDLSPGRPFLHASELGFEHPFTGDPVMVASSLPRDLAEVLDRLAPDIE